MSRTPLGMFTQYKGLPKQIYLLLAARVVSALGAFVYAILALFLSSRLGFDDLAISRYMLLMAAINVPAALLGGKLADMFSRKKVYITVILISNVFYLLTGFNCESVTAVWLMLGGMAFMNMSMPVLSAMMMDLTTPQNRQESFSLIYLGYNLGHAIGPLIAGLLFENHLQWIFWGQALTSTLSMILVAFVIKDTTPDKAAIAAIAADASRAKERASEGSVLRHLVQNPIVLFFFIGAIVFAVGYAQLSYILPLNMRQLFGDMSARYYSVVWSINGAVVAFTSPLLVYLSKKRSPLFNMAISGIMYAVGFGIYAFSTSLPLIWLLAISWSAGEVMSTTNTGVFIANHAPVSHRARFQSMFDITKSAGRAIGPMIMGIFLQNRTYAQGWILTAILCFAAVGLFFGMFAYERRHSSAL